MLLFKTLLKWLTGGGVSAIGGQLRQAYEAKLNAGTKEAKLDAELDIQRLENALGMARAANDDRLSATSIGRYLIVVPFGVWWSAVFVDSIFNMTWDVLALPPEIMALAVWLIPAIIVGDIGKSALKRK